MIFGLRQGDVVFDSLQLWSNGEGTLLDLSGLGASKKTDSFELLHWDRKGSCGEDDQGLDLSIFR